MQPSGTSHIHLTQGHGVHVPCLPQPIPNRAGLRDLSCDGFPHSAAKDDSALPFGLDLANCGLGGVGGWLAARAMLMSPLFPCRFVNTRACGDTFGVPDTQLGVHETARAVYCSLSAGS